MLPEMTEPAPRVSVIMPVYNAREYLAQAITSILEQSFRDFEFIVLDDASQDGSWEIIQSFAGRDRRIVPLRNRENLKLSKTLNRGITQARGTYLVRMDADDISLPKRLAIQVAYMDAHSEVGISGGTMQVINARGKIIGRRRYHLEDAAIRGHIFRYSPFSHPAVIIRKSVLDQAGPYDPEFNPAEDYELYFRLGRLARFGNVPESLIHYRVVPRSMTTGSTRAMELKTLAIRKIAVKIHHYRMSWWDYIYLIMQYLSVYIIPYPVKIWIFNQLSGLR